MSISELFSPEIAELTGVLVVLAGVYFKAFLRC